MGESVFLETDPNFFIFGFAYIPFVTHRDEYRVSHAGVSSPDLYQNQVLYIKKKDLRDFTSSSGHETC